MDGEKANKGQLILECLFDVLNFPKYQQKIWQIGHFLEVLEVPISDLIAIRELSNAVIILLLLLKRKF